MTTTTEAPVRKVPLKPSPAFVGAAWLAFAVGAVGYIVAVWTATDLNRQDKYFYVAAGLLGLWGAVCVSKAMRDREEGIPVTAQFLGLSWVAVLSAIGLMGANLWEAPIADVNRAYFGATFLLTIFATIVVQKNVRDTDAAKRAASDWQ